MTEGTRLPALGLVGVGNIGGAMARHLLRAGYPLTVFDIVAEKVAIATKLGASAAASAYDVVRSSEITLLSLPTSKTCIGVMETQETGILAAVQPGSIIIDTGTTLIPETRRIAALVNDVGGAFLDAPVSGGQKGADDATLAVMVGGEAAVFERCRPIFMTIGANAVHIGEAGTGQIVKAVNQIAMGVAEAAFLEAMHLGVQSGVAPERIWEVLRAAGAAKTAFQQAANFVIGGDAQARDVKLRELPYYIAQARELNINLPLTEALHAFASEGENRITDASKIPLPSFWYELTHRKREE